MSDAVKKEIESLKQKELNYNQIKNNLINTAQKLFGEDIMDNYFIPDDFDISSLNEDEILCRHNQEVSVPYSNFTFREMLEMPKKVVKNIFIKPNKNKNVQGMFLIGKTKNGKYALFALTIVRDTKNKGDYSIVLDVKVKGKFYMNLARIDCSIGMSHPNYIKDGKVIDREEDLVRVPTPHLHLAQEETQVLFNENLDYSLATSLLHLQDLSQNIESDKNLMTYVNYMLKLANINVRTMQVDTSKYGNYLFNFEDVECINTPKDLER